MKLRSRRITTLALIFLMVLGLGLAASVQAEYPEKPIELIVGYKAGGATDSMARILAKAMQDQLGQPVLVINKPGGGGFLAASTISKSAPDGYKIAITGSLAYTFMPHFMAKQNKEAFKVDDFLHLATVGDFQMAYVGPPSVQDWQMLISMGKQKGSLSVAGLTPMDTLVARFIAKKEGVRIKVVPFKGGSETMTAVMGNHTDFAFSGGVHIKYTKAGKLNTLAAFDANGLAAEPEVPTLQKLGYGIDAAVVNTVSLPKGTPENVIEKLQSAVAKSVETKEYTDLMTKIRFPINYRGSAATTQFLSKQYITMKDLFEYVDQP